MAVVYLTHYQGMRRHGTNPVRTKSIALNLKGQKKENTKKSCHHTVPRKQGEQAHLAVATVKTKMKSCASFAIKLLGH